MPMIISQEGDWTIEELTADEALAEPSISADRETLILRRGKEIIMSDSPQEMADMRDFVDQAYGDILVIGLGLGLVLKELEKNCKVQEITVLEKHQEVIELVTIPYRVVLGDAYTYLPDRKWDCVWIDIWNHDYEKLDRWTNYCTILGMWNYGIR